MVSPNACEHQVVAGRCTPSSTAAVASVSGSVSARSAAGVAAPAAPASRRRTRRAWPRRPPPRCRPRRTPRCVLVDPLAHLRVSSRVADAVALLGERLADDLELVRVLGGVAEQDRAVGGHRVDGAVEHLVARTRSRCRSRAAWRLLLLDVLERGRAGHRADLLCPRGRPGRDRSSLSARDQQLLAGDVVRAGLADDAAALVGDRVRREDEVDLPSCRNGSRLSEIVSFQLDVAPSSMPRSAAMILAISMSKPVRHVVGRRP